MPLKQIQTLDGSTVLVNVIDNDGRLFPLTDWDDPAVHPPTRGVSSAYIAAEYPKAVYTSYTNHITVGSKEEEAEVLKQGGSLNRNDFETPMEIEETNDIVVLKRQMAALQELLAKQGDQRKASKQFEGKPQQENKPENK